MGVIVDPYRYGVNNNGATQYPTFTTSGTTNVYLAPQSVVAAPLVVPQPEPGPLDWLREQVDEVRELARAA